MSPRPEALLSTAKLEMKRFLIAIVTKSIILQLVQIPRHWQSDHWKQVTREYRARESYLDQEAVLFHGPSLPPGNHKALLKLSTGGKPTYKDEDGIWCPIFSRHPNFSRYPLVSLHISFAWLTPIVLRVQNWPRPIFHQGDISSTTCQGDISSTSALIKSVGRSLKCLFLINLCP